MSVLDAPAARRGAIALGALALAGIGTLGGHGVTAALWHDEEVTPYTLRVPGARTQLRVDGQDVPVEVAPSYGWKAETGGVDPFWGEESLTTLASQHEVYRLVEYDQYTYGAMMIDGYLDLDVQGEGPLLDGATVRTYRIEDPARCGADGSLTDDDLLGPDQDGVELLTDPSAPHGNITLCVVATLPDAIGVPGGHTDTMTVTGTDGVSGDQVTGTDSWTGTVSRVEPDYTDQVDQQLAYQDEHGGGSVTSTGQYTEVMFPDEGEDQ